jgi:hypothetical protein
MRLRGAWGAPVSAAASLATLTDMAARLLKIPSQCLSTRSSVIYSMKRAVRGPHKSVLKLSAASTYSPVRKAL